MFSPSPASSKISAPYDRYVGSRPILPNASEAAERASTGSWTVGRGTDHPVARSMASPRRDLLCPGGRHHRAIQAPLCRDVRDVRRLTAWDRLARWPGWGGLSVREDAS